MKNSDAPAMPVMDESDWGQHYGLSKREELAARNMAAILTQTPPFDINHDLMPEFMAQVADYAILGADTLLAALEKTGGES